ncbi:MAG: metalloregulator ArsR/SmtB family transcription factor [Acidobacteriota bacterium]|jgi:DNA-binding transcriptional ArsR family regulator|nr:MAG: transcriptional regulator [Acidobacteriota bacterium]
MSDAIRQFKAQLFQALAHPTRIAIVEALRDGEVGAGALAEQLQVEQANLSQHLAVLRNRHIVVGRKEGNQVFYTVRDPLLIDVLDRLKSFIAGHLQDTLAALNEAEAGGALSSQ